MLQQQDYTKTNLHIWLITLILNLITPISTAAIYIELKP